MGSATLLQNTGQTGKVGVVSALPTGQTLSQGTRQIVTIRFDVLPSADAGPSPLGFADQPVFRETVDAEANPLATTFLGGSVNILGPTSANVAIAGTAAGKTGGIIAGVRVHLTLPSGEIRTAVTNSFGKYRFEGLAAGVQYVLSASGTRYVFENPVRIVSAVEEVTTVDFTAIE
jgi:hypothetical protein